MMNSDISVLGAGHVSAFRRQRMSACASAFLAAVFAVSCLAEDLATRPTCTEMDKSVDKGVRITCGLRDRCLAVRQDPLGHASMPFVGSRNYCFSLLQKESQFICSRYVNNKISAPLGGTDPGSAAKEMYDATSWYIAGEFPGGFHRDKDGSKPRGYLRDEDVFGNFVYDDLTRGIKAMAWSVDRGSSDLNYRKRYVQTGPMESSEGELESASSVYKRHRNEWPNAKPKENDSPGDDCFMVMGRIERVGAGGEPSEDSVSCLSVRCDREITVTEPDVAPFSVEFWAFPERADTAEGTFEPADGYAFIEGKWLSIETKKPSGGSTSATFGEFARPKIEENATCPIDTFGLSVSLGATEDRHEASCYFWRWDAIIKWEFIEFNQ